MKKLNLILWVLVLFSGCSPALAQTINAAYVKALYAKYPTQKSPFCPACKLWVNPYYKSIADTFRHMPLITYEHFAKNPKLIAKRTGVFAAWHSVTGQPNEDNVYKAANQTGIGEIAKGHCEAWVLNSFSNDAAILSDTYTFNAACEYQGQNIGTEIQSEENTRTLLKTTDVDVWCGTFLVDTATYRFFTDGNIKDALPDVYWKVIKYGDKTICYWMPNLPSETRAKLKEITYAELVKNLGFDPEKTLN